MLILGIESTCDETGASIVLNGKKVLSNIVASSADLHERYGGVFPEIASRRHLETIIPVIREALQAAGVAPADLHGIAVAKGPGLVGALLVGMNVAKGLSLAWKKPLIGVNHVEAHLYAAMMDLKAPPLFPALGVVLSGGHTLILRIDAVGQYTGLGTTVDDAIGEAFDKVASLLGLPYPGGPHVERLAKSGTLGRYAFSPGRVKKNLLDFSFSGLKTNVLYAIKGQNGSGNLPLTDAQKADVAASFQETALRDVVAKAALAIEIFPCRALYFGGGVCNNQRLRALVHDKFDLPAFWPAPHLTLDNAAMIAGLGYHKFLQNPSGDPLNLEVQTRIPLA